MTRMSSPALVLVFLALPASAQSFNVDFEPVPNPYGSVPATHAGAAGSPGVWNSVSSAAVSHLLTLNGVSTNVALVRTTSGAFTHLAISDIDPGMDAVLNDFAKQATSANGQNWRFSNLSPGEYVITTICTSEAEDVGGNGLWVSVPQSAEGTRFAFSYGPGYFEGQTYTVHHKTVLNGTIDVTVDSGGLIPSDNVINGIQIVRESDSVGTSMCFGDGTGGACPCANSGGPGRGCQNSSGTGGALLSATGTVSPDTIVFRSSEMRPSALTIFLQGSSIIPVTPFGDGLRCAGNPLRRLYTKDAVGGIAVAPSAGEPSVTQRAAALGDSIDPGDRRYYQAYYRDGHAGFCPAPQGATFNSSQLLKLTW